MTPSTWPSLGRLSRGVGIRSLILEVPLIAEDGVATRHLVSSRLESLPRRFTLRTSRLGVGLPARRIRVRRERHEQDCGDS